MKSENQIKGALYGIQIGDALGAAVEGLSEHIIKWRYGKIDEYKSGIWGIPYFLRGKGSGTDDTRLSLAVLNGLMRNDPEQGLNNQFNRERFNFSHVGKALFYAYLLHRKDWKVTGHRVHKKLHGKTAGNGALMRTLPVALLFTSLEDIKKYTKMHAEMTHLNEISTESCYIYNHIAYLILRGNSIKEAIDEATSQTRYEGIYLTPPSFKPDGFAYHTLSWTLYWLFHSIDFESCVVDAVNKGGDADTIASLVGGIAGLAYGFDSIPEYLRLIKGSNRLDTYTQKALHFRESNL